jgi:esterase/lipase superfamily enzyme
MRGTYDVEQWLKGQWYDDFYFYSPLAFVPNLSDGEQLHRLKQRFVLLATGSGDYENPAQTWQVADTLGARNIPNRVDVWEGWKHDWDTWRAMLPHYVGELLE